MLTLGARLAFGFSAAVVPVSDATLLAVFLATFFATARGFFTGASPALSTEVLLRALADFTDTAASAAVLLLPVSGLRLRGALADSGACVSEGTCAAPFAVLGAFVRGLRAALGLSAAALPTFVDDASLTDEGLAGDDTCSVGATGDCAATAGAVVPGFCSTAGAPALR